MFCRDCLSCVCVRGSDLALNELQEKSRRVTGRFGDCARAPLREFGLLNELQSQMCHSRQIPCKDSASAARGDNKEPAKLQP